MHNFKTQQLPQVGSATITAAAATTASDNFISTPTDENISHENTIHDKITSLKISSNNKTTGKHSKTGKKTRRNSTLDNMQSFLASFNKQQDKTRELLSEIKTPTTLHGKLVTTSSKTSAAVAAQNKRVRYLKSNNSAAGNKSINSPIKRQVNDKQSIADFLASDHHFENNHGSMSPSAVSWIEGLRRMREKKAGKTKMKTGGMTPGGQPTPSSVRNNECPEQALEIERTRLARRLSTLSFPMKACMAALEECNGDIEKSVALLLRWYPKGSGGRGAVQNLIKIIIGAEKKLQSLRAKLQILYAPSMSGVSTGDVDMTSAVRAIFDKYDHDGSGSIDHQEFREMLKDLGVSMTKSEFQEAITMLDNDHNGEVDFEEFLGWWKQNAGNGVVLSDDIDSLFRHVLQEAKSIVNADKASLLLVDFETGELWSRVCDADMTIRMPMFKGVAGHVVRTGQVLNVPDAHVDARFNPEFDRKTGYVTKQILAIPILGDMHDANGGRPDSAGSAGTPESDDSSSALGGSSRRHQGKNEKNGKNATKKKSSEEERNDNQQHKRIIYGVVEVMNSHDDLDFSAHDQAKLVELCERIRHGVINVCMMQQQQQSSEQQHSSGAATSMTANKKRNNMKSDSLPVLLPMSPQRVRPSTSPAKSSKYKKLLKGSQDNNTAMSAELSGFRRHTYNSTPSLHQHTNKATNKIHLGPRLSFADTSTLSKEERMSYMVYKSKQLGQRNKNRGNVASNMASMLATYDKTHGIKQKSPKRRYQKLGKYLSKNNKKRQNIRTHELPGL